MDELLGNRNTKFVLPLFRLFFSLRCGKLFTAFSEKCGEAHGPGKVNPIEVTRLISARLATNFERGSIMASTVDGTFNLEHELALTEKEQAELERAKALLITFDEDCPETTSERALRFRRVNPVRSTASH